MQLLRVLVAVLGLMALAPSCADEEPSPTDAPTTQEPLPAALAGTLLTAFDAVMADAGAPGGWLTISSAEWEPWTAVWGTGKWDEASGSEGVAMEPGTAINIASATKTFVTAMVMQLREEGRLGLDDAVTTHLPDLGLDERITIRHLLGHQSGLANFTSNTLFLLVEGKTPYTPEEIVAFSVAEGLDFEPGSQGAYSNTGFIVIGLLLEALESKPFAEILEERIVEPMGLVNTYVWGDPSPTNDYSLGFREGEPIPDADALDPSWAWSAFGIYSVGADVCRFLRAVLNPGKVVSAESLAVMHEFSYQRADGNVDYMHGISTLSYGGLRQTGHVGGSFRSRGQMGVHPESGICVTVFLNDMNANRQLVSDTIWSTLASELALQPSPEN